MVMLKNFLILGLVAGSLAVKCYVCESKGNCESAGTDCSCQDPYEPKESHLVDCSTDSEAIDDGGCTKSKGGAKVFGKWYYDVSRSCGKRASSGHCEKAIKGSSQDPNNPSDPTYYDWKAFNCTCTDDKCNSAVQTSISFAAALLFTLVSYVI